MFPIKKLLSCVFLLVMVFSVYSNETIEVKNHGEKMPRPFKNPPPFENHEDNVPFFLAAVKVSDETEEGLYIDLNFSKKISFQALKLASVEVDGKPVTFEYFIPSKGRRKFRVLIKNPQKNFNLLVKNVVSDYGEVIPEAFIENVFAGKNYHFMPERKMERNPDRNLNRNLQREPDRFFNGGHPCPEF